MHDDRYYRPSGAIPLAGTLLMLLCGSAAAAGLAFAYALLTAFNPFVYLTALGTVVFGVGVGGAVVFGAMAGKVRHQAFIVIVAACAALVGLYLTWVFYIPYILGRMGLPGVPFVFEPKYVFEAIRTLGQNGVWEIFGWSPTGWQLFAFWVLEAAIILGGAVIVAAASRKPFCEACGRWTNEEKLARPLALTDPDLLRATLENERFEILDDLRDHECAPDNALRATLHTCPQCADSDFLTVAHVRVTTGKDGNVQTQTTEIIRRLRIPHSLVEHLRVALVEAPLFPPATSPPSVDAGGVVADTDHDDEDTTGNPTVTEPSRRAPGGA
jgi:hypothetical protein